MEFSYKSVSDFVGVISPKPRRRLRRTPSPWLFLPQRPQGSTGLLSIR